MKEESCCRPCFDPEACRGFFESSYRKWHHKEFVHPDPLEFLYAYGDLPDREVIAFLASSLAYGRVSQILKSIERAIQPLGPHPSLLLPTLREGELAGLYSSFCHRFTSGEELAALLEGIRRLIERYGSLGQSFFECFTESGRNPIGALESWGRELLRASGMSASSLICLPSRGSACKRHFLFLRWMVRCDAVDPGGWEFIPPSALVVPLDVHLHRVSRFFGLTTRAQADLKTALQITEAFRILCPEDPLRYDFSLTRWGIRKEESPFSRSG